MLTISVTAFVLVLITGLVAILLGVIKENAPSASSFWWFLAYWIAALSFLWAGHL